LTERTTKADGADEGGATERSGGAAETEPGLFGPVPGVATERVDASAATEDDGEGRGGIDTKRVAKKLATLVSEENARLGEQVVGALREAQGRLAQDAATVAADLVAMRVAECCAAGRGDEPDVELGRRAASLRLAVNDAEDEVVAALQAALPKPRAHMAPVVAARAAFETLRASVGALCGAIGLVQVTPEGAFDSARHRILRAVPTNDEALDRIVAHVVRDGEEMRRGERCVVVEPALVEVFTFKKEA